MRLSLLHIHDPRHIAVESSVKKAGTTCSHDLCPFQRRKAEIQAQVEIIKRGEGRCVRALLYTESTVHQL